MVWQALKASVKNKAFSKGPSHKLGTNAPSGLATMTPAVAEADNYTSWIINSIRPYLGARIVEIGLGFGNYRRYLAQGELYAGIDIDEEAVARSKKEDPEGKYYCLDISAPGAPAELAPLRLDTVVSINVLEHIVDDTAAVRNMIEILQPGGCVAIFVPAMPSLYGDMDRLAGHHRRYTAKGLHILIESIQQVRLCELAYFNPVGAFGWWVNTFFRHSKLDHSSIEIQTRLFDMLCVPVSRFINPLFKNKLGQSLLCVIQKV